MPDYASWHFSSAHKLAARQQAQALFELEELGPVHTLSDTDLCIHSAVHLFAEGECHNGLRDLSDLPIADECLRPKGRRNAVLAWAWRRIFTPSHSSCRLPGHRVAAFLLYCRGHFLRMSLYLLLPHLLKKAWRRQFDGAGTVGQRT